VIVLLVWATAAVVAAALLAVLAFELLGHIGRLKAAVALASLDLVPLAQRLAARPDPDACGAANRAPTSWLERRGRHRADP
jgi:hypothetical protein